MIKLIENNALPNTISIDIEEYYHAENLSSVTPRRRWPYLPTRVVESTENILEILENTNTKATFFILGNVARRNKDLIRQISAQGHEIASHGFRHKLAYNQSPASFFRDVSATKKLLEDISGKKVIGYRAPNFSITDLNPWAYEILVNAGYKYDSSLYPTSHPRYNNTGKPRRAFIMEASNGELVIFPLAVASLNFFGHHIPCPVAGGAYWRLLPQLYINWGLQQMQKERLAANCYTHPWEFDFGQPVFEELPLLTKLRHYGRTKCFPNRFSKMLKRFQFTTIEDAFRQVKIDCSPATVEGL